MHVAIAGSGDLAKYMSEEFIKAGCYVSILSRREKPDFPTRSNPKLTFKIVDFMSTESLSAALKDCGALVSTILDYTATSITIHMTLLEACKRSPSCKRFIPSEFAGNIDAHPNKPAFYAHNHVPVREALAKQTEVEWTSVNVGWISDYCVPRANRYMKNIGAFFPIDLQARTCKIPGTGNELVDFTSARDIARACVELITSSQKWESSIYIRGERSSFNALMEVMDNFPWSKGLLVSYLTEEQLRDIISRGESEEAVLNAEFALSNIEGVDTLPEDKLLRQKEKYFPSLRFRTVKEMMEEVKKGVVV